MLGEAFTARMTYPRQPDLALLPACCSPDAAEQPVTLHTVQCPAHAFRSTPSHESFCDTMSPVAGSSCAGRGAGAGAGKGHRGERWVLRLGRWARASRSPRRGPAARRGEPGEKRHRRGCSFRALADEETAPGEGELHERCEAVRTE